jgi:hypothetical protein
MPQDPVEQFAGNSAINAEIHNILSSFPEPSRSRMRKKIRQNKATSDRLGTDQADESARHTFREFLVAQRLNSTGFCLEYEKSVNGQTPDWYDEQNRIVLEVFTCERGGRSSPVQRVATRLAEKATRYRALVRDKSLHFVIAVHGDFLSAFDADDCEQAIADDRLFERHPEVSGVIWFGETKVVRVKQTDGSMARKQLYGYSYFANTNATRKIDLSMNLRGDEAMSCR